MHRVQHRAAVIGALLAGTVSTAARAQSFVRVLQGGTSLTRPQYVGVGMDASGSLIFGNAIQYPFSVGSIWDSTGELLSEWFGMQYAAVSADGRTLAGVLNNNRFVLLRDGVEVPFPVPLVQGRTICGLSDDGSVVLGSDFVWSERDGLWPDAARGLLSTLPKGISGNGRYAMGSIPGPGTNTRVPARFSATASWERIPGFPSAGRFVAEATNVDGSVVLAQQGSTVALWREGRGITSLPLFGDRPFLPTGMTQDGGAVLGVIYSEYSTAAWWTDADGIQLLVDVAENGHGLEIYPWNLDWIVAATNDRHTMVVQTMICNESRLALLRLDGDAGCRADLNCDGFVDFFDYAEFISAFENASRLADVNRDCFVDFFDYDDFVAAFESGC